MIFLQSSQYPRNLKECSTRLSNAAFSPNLRNPKLNLRRKVAERNKKPKLDKLDTSPAVKMKCYVPKNKKLLIEMQAAANMGPPKRGQDQGNVDQDRDVERIDITVSQTRAKRSQLSLNKGEVQQTEQCYYT